MRSLKQQWKLAGLALCAGTLMAASGCMTTPGNYENVGSINDAVEFTGWLQNPGHYVKIQARMPGEGNWVNIGGVRAGDTPYSYSRNTWYSWDMECRIPRQFWTYLDGHYWAEVRAVDRDSNRLLFTFEDGFNSYFNFREPLETLWADHGYGNSVTIAAD